MVCCWKKSDQTNIHKQILSYNKGEKLCTNCCWLINVKMMDCKKLIQLYHYNRRQVFCKQENKILNTTLNKVRKTILLIKTKFFFFINFTSLLKTLFAHSYKIMIFNSPIFFSFTNTHHLIGEVVAVGNHCILGNPWVAVHNRRAVGRTLVVGIAG